MIKCKPQRLNTFEFIYIAMRGKKTIIGLTEKVIVIGKKKRKLTARIDTGATISSIDAKLAAGLSLGPIVRTKMVKSAHGSRSRPVVIVKIKIKNKTLESEFTIADRKHMKYAVLIGQNILKEGFLIDPTK